MILLLHTIFYLRPGACILVMAKEPLLLVDQDKIAEERFDKWLSLLEECVEVRHMLCFLLHFKVSL